MSHCRSRIFYEIIIFLIFVLNELEDCSTAEILGIFHMPIKGHAVITHHIMELLSLNGHNVTVVSLFPSEKGNSNFTHIDFSDGTEKPVKGTLSIIGDHYGVYLWRDLRGLETMEAKFCRKVYANPQFQKLLSEDRKFDVIFTQTLIIHCYLPLADKFNASVIAVQLMRSWAMNDVFIGSTTNPSYVPCEVSDRGQKMNFIARIYNTLDYVIQNIHRKWFANKVAAKISSSFLGIQVEIENFYSKVALVFNNNHFSFLNRPSLENSIDISGINIKPRKPLNGDIEKFINDSKDGVVYFSFGSMYNMSTLPLDVAKIFLNAFSKIPQHVIWQYGNIHNLEIPKNIHIGLWFPQLDILRHKNVKLFISHCGIMGTYEAIHTATPMLGIPTRADQKSNAALLVEKQVALQIDFDDFTEQELSTKLDLLLNDERYRINMQELSDTFNDRPMPVEDTILYWTNYVIRNKGGKHLRSITTDIPFYKLFLLDVIAFSLILLLIIVLLFYKTFKNLKVISVILFNKSRNKLKKA